MTARTTATDSDDVERSPRGGERTSDAVIRAVTDARGVDPATLDPLYPSIDLDALDQLFASSSSSGKLTLDIADCRVTVRADGRVSATRLDQVATE
jgi:hypothetical protein